MKLSMFIVITVLYATSSYASEQTKSSQSSYNTDIKKAVTSKDITKADLAWHAQNTYGWDCAEVISVGKKASNGSYKIKCSSGIELKVYPREGKHPKITNAKGSYK